MRSSLIVISAIVGTLIVGAGGSTSACGAEQPASAETEPEFSAVERSHWSFQRPVRHAVPTFDSPADRRWVRNPIDAFVLRKLNENGLRPATEADRVTLIRRLTFDLTGLPPTPDEVDDFRNDRASGAYLRLVERLLASPHYGQRWGQHWLDVVRFAETEGFEYDRHHPHAWRFRDYVIRSFNDDKPYDRFVTEQLAGDELATASALPDQPTTLRAVPVGARERLNGKAHRELQIAAGFHRLGPVRRNAGNPEVAFSRNEVLTERTNIIGAAFLGLTIGCARCHDHMFDPIPQKDYYRLQAFFAATYEYDVPLADEQTRAAWKKRNDQVEAGIKRIKEAVENATEEQRPKLEAELERVESNRPEPLPEIFSVRNVAEQRTPIYRLERGDENHKAERVEMRPPGVLLPEGAVGPPADSTQPKLELARWLVSPENPLTARVMVNRIWQYHFGRGLVETANDFGLNGDSPTHPELLDWLAVELVERGWSVKAMHRLIVTSSTYRQSSIFSVSRDLTGERVDEVAARERDPENQLLSRFNRRRLTAEEIRDAMLLVSDRLNRKAGGPSVMVPVDSELIGLLYKPSQWQVTADPREHDRRSVYLIAKRNLRLPFMDVFDQPDLQISCDRRESSTHAPQALELLNGRLSNELALAFAERLRREAIDRSNQPRARATGRLRSRLVNRAFLLTTGRPPTDVERELAVEFLESQPLSEFALALFNLNAFLYVD